VNRYHTPAALRARLVRVERSLRNLEYQVANALRTAGGKRDGYFGPVDVLICEKKRHRRRLLDQLAAPVLGALPVGGQS